jgi:septation ring formation regulator EzrA
MVVDRPRGGEALMGDPYAVSRLHDELRELKDENKHLKRDLDNVSKKYLLLITEFKKHLEQDAEEKQ